MTTYATFDLAAQHHRELIAEAEHRRTVKTARAATGRRGVRAHAHAFRSWLEAGQL
jgi:hypothetical protein